MTTFSLYWSDWLCSWALRRGQEGEPLTHLWGGWNQNTAPLRNVKPGDRVVVTSGFAGCIYLLGDLSVRQVGTVDRSLEAVSPHSCASTVVAGIGTSKFRLDRVVPPRWLGEWTFVNANGKLREVRNFADGRLKKTNSFQGCYRIDDCTAERALAVLTHEETASREELLSSSDALRALERNLATRPDDVEAVQVFVDALMEAGDARAEATALELELREADVGRHRQITRKLNKLLKTRGEELVGRPGGFPFRLSWGPRKKVRVAV